MSNNDNNNENNTTANTDEYEKVCYICRRSESKAGKMINMPGGLCVCADCMQKTFDTINNSDINYDDLMNNMPNMGMFGGFNMMGNDISNRQKVKKKKLALPKKLINVKKCKNPRCITSTEPGIVHIFKLADEKNRIYRCIYCEADK